VDVVDVLDVPDVPRTMESAMTAHASAAAAIHVIFIDTTRRTLGQRACLAPPTDADESGGYAGGGGGAELAPAELPAADGPDIALDTG
jgi:hypothetical protein